MPTPKSNTVASTPLLTVSVNGADRQGGCDDGTVRFFSYSDICPVANQAYCVTSVSNNPPLGTISFARVTFPGTGSGTIAGTQVVKAYITPDPLGDTSVLPYGSVAVQGTPVGLTRLVWTWSNPGHVGHSSGTGVTNKMYVWTQDLKGALPLRYDGSVQFQGVTIGGTCTNCPQNLHFHSELSKAKALTVIIVDGPFRGLYVAERTGDRGWQFATHDRKPVTLSYGKHALTVDGAREKFTVQLTETSLLPVAIPGEVFGSSQDVLVSIA